MARHLPRSEPIGGVADHSRRYWCSRRRRSRRRRAAAVTKGKLTLVVIMTIIKAKLIVVAAIFGAAPCAVAVFPKHPHIEGLEAVLLEVEGAPPAQVVRVGKRLPSAGQGHIAIGR